VFARFGQDKDSAMQVASTGELEPGDADDLGPVLAAAEGLVKLHPKDPLAARHLGAAYLRAGKVEAAIDELTRAAMLRKHTPVPWLLLAIAHHRAGHDGEGRQWLIKAQQFLDLAQKNPDAAVDGGNIVWNRLSWSERLKVQLFRREAEAALGEIAASGK
jgi:Flp pilus assembly protein TadD